MAEEVSRQYGAGGATPAQEPAKPDESAAAQERKLLGSLIRSARRRKGMTAAQLGDALDPSVTESAVTSWERGRTMPAYQAVEQMDAILGVSLNDLMAAREQVGATMPASREAASERADHEARLLAFEQMLSMEGLERLVEYAEFLASHHPREDSAE